MRGRAQRLEHHRAEKREELKPLKRRIEAAILKHVYDSLKASHGVETAKKTIAAAVRQSAVDQARELAAAVVSATGLERLPPNRSNCAGR